MLTFKNYLSARPTNLQTAQVAVELAVKVADPESYILDFAEQRYPHLYPQLVRRFTESAPALPSDAAGGDEPGAMPTDAGNSGTNPAISKRGKQFNNMMGGLKQAANETGISGLLGKIAGWFGGGGAQKNFETAMKSLQKVKGVFDTIKVPDALVQNDERFKNYAGFVEELGTAMQSLQKFKDAPEIAGLLDQLKKNPEQFQINQEAAKSVDAEVSGGEEPADPSGTGGGTGDTGGAAAGGEDEAHLKPVAANVVGRVKHDLFNGNFDSFPADKQAQAKAEVEKIKALPDDTQQHNALAKLMRQLGNTEADKNESRRRKGGVINESYFSDAMALAGIPATTRKRTK